MTGAFQLFVFFYFVTVASNYNLLAAKRYKVDCNNHRYRFDHESGSEISKTLKLRFRLVRLRDLISPWTLHFSLPYHLVEIPDYEKRLNASWIFFHLTFQSLHLQRLQVGCLSRCNGWVTAWYFYQKTENTQTAGWTTIGNIFFDIALVDWSR